MRIVIFIFFLIAFTACHNRQHNFLQDDHAWKRIVLQPLEHFNTREDTALLDFLSEELHRFYNREIIIAQPLSVPASFINTEKGKRYSADSVLHLLAALKNDSTATIIGLTHEDIFTTIRDEEGRIKEPAYKYKVWGIFGLGYRPGYACVISDHRFHTANNALYYHRLRTVVLHETGHNLGLRHCPTPGCIMSDANEKIATVDNSGNDYCAQCKKKLKQQQ